MRRSWTSTKKALRAQRFRRAVTRLLWLSPLVLVLALLVGSELTRKPGPVVQAQDGARARKLRVKDRSVARRLDQIGGRLVADYGGYLLYEAPAAAVEEARGNPAVELVDEYRFVLLNSGPVDTESDAGRNLRSARRERFDGKRMHIVQLVGPSRPEWLAAIRETGVQVVTYLPHNAYLVYADDASVGALGELESSARFIQWQAPYRNEHKVHPRARRAARLRSLRLRSRLDRSAAATAPAEEL